MPKTVDTDYLFLTTRVRSLENFLLSAERREQMLEAYTDQEAVKVLEECGYPELEELNPDSLNAMLAAERDRVFKELYFFTPDASVVDLFKIKYDYHNAKVLLKSETMAEPPLGLLVEAGRVPTRQMQEALRTGEFQQLPPFLKAAVTQAREVLRTTRDPQLADFALDQGYFADMFDLAARAESHFIDGYVRLSIDAANLRSVIRTQRMGKSQAFLEGVLFEGGNLFKGRILACVTAEGSIAELFATSELSAAAEAGAACLGGASLTGFEKLCDNALQKYLSSARYVSFGEEPVIAYLAAKEAELTAIRIIMSGRMAHLSAEVIRERLRDSYV